jgi:hypothetical protein
MADLPETHPVGIDVSARDAVAATKTTTLALDRRKTSLEGTSETHTGEPKKENREKSDGNLETTKTKTNNTLDQELSKNATLTLAIRKLQKPSRILLSIKTYQATQRTKTLPRSCSNYFLN